MRRRAVILRLGGLATAYPFAAHAQRTGGVPTVGVLMAGNDRAPENLARIAAFRQGMATLGWRDGENVRIAYRWSEGKSELIRRFAEELVALAPVVIVANSTPVVAAFKEIGTTIPVVFALTIDPIGQGHVKSLSRPGGNFTGFTFIDGELLGKWGELLKDVAPGLTRASVLFDPVTAAFYRTFVRELAAARPPGAIDLVAMPVGTTGEMETALSSFAQTPGGGVMIGPDPFNQIRLGQIVQLAKQHRLPAISVYRPFATQGGLMAYGPDTADIFRRSAGYIDRILKGAKPADLPVQQPAKFELTINLKTAKELGLEVPARVLVNSDEVIE